MIGSYPCSAKFIIQDAKNLKQHIDYLMTIKQYWPTHNSTAPLVSKALFIIAKSQNIVSITTSKHLHPTLTSLE